MDERRADRGHIDNIRDGVSTILERGLLMKTVYIAHPIAGDRANNMVRVLMIMKDIMEGGDDIRPLAPYIVTLLIYDDAITEERRRGMEYNERLIMRGHGIDEIWFYGNRMSEGMYIELALAIERRIRVVGKTPETRAAIDKYIKEKGLERWHNQGQIRLG